MSERKSKGCLIATVAWCFIFLLLAVAYKFLVHPYFSKKLTEETGSNSRYEHEINVAADSFSGYAVLRSPVLKQWLTEKQIKLNVIDDGADYSSRLKSLEDGSTQLAVFTIDSYLNAGIRNGSFPGSIILVLDETQGGDALVAHESAFNSIQDLNQPSTRLVLTPDSPSEFLARVILAHFSLPNINKDWLTPEDGSKQVLNHLKKSRAADKKAFVMWQPHIAKALKEPGYKVLLDSSQLKGYIVDVLVAERSFLKENPSLIQTFTEGYFRALFHYQNKSNGIQTLITQDANLLDSEKLDSQLANAVAKGVQWKNTVDNYSHFGLEGRQASVNHPYLEDMIGNIMGVLIKTKSIATDPLNGQYNTLYYDQVLKALKASQFHPGQDLNLIQGLQNQAETTSSSESVTAVPLSENQWNNLMPVGELQVEAIGFVRGSSNVSRSSGREIASLVKRLQSFPNFYLEVIGQTRAEGNADANRRLATARADTVATLLKQNGLEDWRIRTEAAPSGDQNGQFQSVVFRVGQQPY
jgi:ABC-type nitrate/sulfonate/bicarbonate transport system substrate-binding protein/outer membrane protein OmpA-like peptidoglycan-associated protein